MRGGGESGPALAFPSPALLPSGSDRWRRVCERVGGGHMLLGRREGGGGAPSDTSAGCEGLKRRPDAPALHVGESAQPESTTAGRAS